MLVELLLSAGPLFALPIDTAPPSGGDISVGMADDQVTAEDSFEAVVGTLGSSTDPVVLANLEALQMELAAFNDCIAYIDVKNSSDLDVRTCSHPLTGADWISMPMYPNRFNVVSSSGSAVEFSPGQFVLSWNEVAALPIQSGTLDLQIASETPHFIHVETPTLSTATEHTLAFTLFDTPIEVRVTPIEWAWDFGQEGVRNITTRTPGGHYPDLTVAPIYQDVAEQVVITATITWEGEYRVGDSAEWLPVFGRGTTTVTSEPFDLREYRTYLLHDPNQPDPTPAPGS